MRESSDIYATGVSSGNNSGNGMDVMESTKIRIIDSTFTNSQSGIYLGSSSSCNLFQTLTEWNQRGITLSNSNLNIISNSTSINNLNEGIYLYDSDANLIINSIMALNHDGIVLDWYSVSNQLVNDYIGCNQEDGIVMINYANTNTVEFSTIDDNLRYGIMLSTNVNMIHKCNITWNAEYGIFATGATNYIYNCNFLYNGGSNAIFNSSSIQAYDAGSNNIWYDSFDYGNYWLDWAENNNTNDLNPIDGVVDWPYQIDGAASKYDQYPLNEPWQDAGSDLPTAAHFNLHLVPGWNFVSIPLVGFQYDASALGLMSGDEVAGWNSSLQTYDQDYIVGLSPSSADFALNESTGYWIYANAYEDISLLMGNIPTSTQSRAIDVPSGGGWVAIGFSSYDARSASEIASLVTGANVLVVSKWDAATQEYIDYVVGFSDSAYDFVLSPGEACWIWVDGSGGVLTYTP
jgi:parallel beta-helix repeat protein